MKRPVWLKTPRWLLRLGASLLIGGQAMSAVAKGRIGFNDLMAELMEAGPGSFLIVLITALAAGTVFNSQVAAELSRQGASATVGAAACAGQSAPASGPGSRPACTAIWKPLQGQMTGTPRSIAAAIAG